MDLPELFAVDDVIVIDGGMSTALAARGVDLSGELWTARALRDDPEAVIAAHLDFLRAGARVVITASYQSSLEGLRRVGIGDDEARALIAKSVELAAEARKRFGAERPQAGPVLVAGSVGPFGAMLAQGQEFTGDYGNDVGRDELIAFHRPRVELLLDAGADLLAVETMPRVDEAAAVLEALRERPWGRAWLSFTGRKGRTAAGDPIEDAARLADASSQVVAVGVNCTPPGEVADLLGRIRSVTTKPLVAYPNAGGRWDAVARAWAPEPRDRFDEDEVRNWLRTGATLVGGCCGIGVQGVADVAEFVRHG
ncbi:MAG: homocysteine S-methyltransferase [Actinomycetota bacterium]